MTTQQHKKSISDLLDIMAALRDPKTGCEWDLAQSYQTIVPYTLEEAYEVADAIEQKDMLSLRDELGDLLFQTVFYARLAEEDQNFDFSDVVDAICNKMLRRHPHVFGSKQQRDQGMVKGQWEQIKADERAEKQRERQALVQTQNSQISHGGGRQAGDHENATETSILADIPKSLPALSRAIKLQNRAAAVGFDWPSLKPVFDKMREELGELEHEIEITQDREAIAAEFGDLMFVMANVARHLGIDPEAALRLTNHKFTNRFQRIESLLAEDGRTPKDSDLEEMDRLWDRAKAEERVKD